jgi:sarcosine oxidase
MQKSMPRFDVIVLGLGAVGSAATWHLARLGAAVLGIDQYSPPHRLGSSHGETRVTRLAIGEGAEYSPLALRSHELWREIERETGERLQTRCGCLIMAGRADGGLVRGVPNFFANTLAAAEKYRIAHELLDTAGLRARFPQFKVQDGETGYLEPEGGYLLPEKCIAAQLTLAERYGARILTNERVQTFRVSGGCVHVETASGQEFAADRILIAAGPWLPALVGAPLQALFKVTRQVLHWFEVRTHAHRFLPQSGCPVFIWQPLGLAGDFYGFPALDGACVKVAWEQKGPPVDPDNVDRTVAPEEVAAMYGACVEPFVPDLGPRSVRSEVCLYTEVAGGRFVIDRHPAHERILFASACSGHGFKHSAAIGEALAEQLTVGRSAKVDLAPFTLARLNGSPAES